MLSDLSFDYYVTNNIDNASNNATPNEIVILANNKNDSNADDGVGNGNEGTTEKSNGSDSSNHDVPSPALETTFGIATNVTNDTSRINNNASINSTSITAVDENNSAEKLPKASQASMVATNEDNSNNSTASSSNLIESINVKQGFTSKVITDIVQYYVNDTKYQKNYNKRINDGKTFNESMKKVKNTTAGVLFTRGKSFTGCRSTRSCKKSEVQDEANQIIQKAAQVYDTRAEFITIL